MFDVEILETCTLQQACEWIAFQRPPMTPTQEKATNFIRPEPSVQDTPVFKPYTLKPTYTWEEYFQQITVCCARLELALKDKLLLAFGINKTIPALTQQIEQLDISDDDNLNWHNNTISSFFSPIKTFR